MLIMKEMIHHVSMQKPHNYQLKALKTASSDLLL